MIEICIALFQLFQDLYLRSLSVRYSTLKTSLTSVMLIAMYYVCTILGHIFVIAMSNYQGVSGNNELFKSYTTGSIVVLGRFYDPFHVKRSLGCS